MPAKPANGGWPTWLPDGSIRAILAILVILLAFISFIFTDKLDLAGLLAITNPVVALYFGQYLSPPGD